LSPYVESALKLHRFLCERHARGGLVGPDPGIRWNYRVGRFVKSALQFLPWNDDLYYVQGQGYWILANGRLFDLTGDDQFLRLAVETSDELLARQRADGAWDYPNPEWKGRVATAEGTWGAIGLLESYRQTGEEKYLRAVRKWHDYLIHTIGFQRAGDELAVNYFANLGSGTVPNNSAFVLRFLAELADVTGDDGYLAPCEGMWAFMQRVQLSNGEFPYVAASPGSPERRHFQCYQYNAFQCLDLMRYLELRGEDVLCPMIVNLLRFLQEGVAPEGYVYYQCDIRYRMITYHTAVAGAAFRAAERHGASEFRASANRTSAYVLRSQHATGGFTYSQGEYRLLRDRRSYPRNLAMILLHQLMHEESGCAAETACIP